MNNGKLIVCGSHTGHLRDVPSRAIEEIKRVKHVFCEHLESFMPIIEYYSIPKPDTIIEISEDRNKQKWVVDKKQRLLEILQSGEDVVFICENGMPGLADPGPSIVGFLHENNIEVVVVPGPDVIGISIAAAGFEVRSSAIVFDEFMNKTKESKLERLRQLSHIDAVLVLIDFPDKMSELIDDAKNILGGSKMAALCSKVTLDDQVIVREKLSDLNSKIQNQEIFTFSSLVISSN